jgi:hypothetical protein
MVLGGVAVALVLGLTQTATAADELQAIIDKAIKAHGIKKEKKDKAVQVKSKGTIELLGGIKFTKTISIQGNKIKDEVEGEAMGQAFTQKVVYNGKEAWLTVNGEEIKLDGLADAIKEAMYVEKVTSELFLKDKAIKLSALGEAKVNGQDAVGVKVSKKGHKDVNLYFDKKTGLVAKVEYRTKDFTTKKEVTEERIITEYQTIKGKKVAKKVLVNRDGKKYITATVTEIKTFDKFDDSEFAKP